MSDHYQLAPFFAVRMTGFPVERLRALESALLAAAVDQLLAAETKLEVVSRQLLEVLRSASVGRAGRKQRDQVEHRRPIESPPEGTQVLSDSYTAALDHMAQARQQALRTYEEELEATRRALYEFAASDSFREVLLLSTPGLEALSPRPGAPLPARNKRARGHEKTWAAYLQRLTTKNETISFFGPCVWGEVQPASGGVFDVELQVPAVARRNVYLERWACDALAERIAADPDARPQLRVAIADELWLEASAAVLLGTNRQFELSPSERALLERCAGAPRLCDLDSSTAVERLAGLGALALKLSLPLSVDPLGALRKELASWPVSPVRERWSSRLAAIAGKVKAIEVAVGLDDRRRAMRDVAAELAEAGIDTTRGSQALYASRLPINEDCLRAAARVSIGKPLIEQLVSDLAPWYELWRDLAALYATRALEVLVPVWRELSAAGAVRLPVFLEAAARAGLPIGRTGGIGAFPGLEAEIQAAWRDELGGRRDDPEIALSERDLSFLRRRFEFRRMRAYDWPAPDVQVIGDRTTVESGAWRLLLGEIHPGFVLWGNALMMWCPDPERFAAAFRHPGHPPALEFASGGEHYYENLHRFNCAPEYTPELWTFTAGLHYEGLRRVRSADITVHLEDGDLVARDAGGRQLGSLIQTWALASNTHQLELIGANAHSPRLTVGRAVVQRRLWVLEPDDLLRAAMAQPPPGPMVALRRLRASLGMPEQVFVRPVLPIRSTYHKDAKPIFVDFRSPLLLELLEPLVDNFRKLHISEMLPALDQTALADADGHYTFELRLATGPG